MSILKRTGTGVSDVAYQDGIKAGDKVFTKDQKWTTGAAGGTYNCVHRTGSGVADIAYQSETIGKALSTYAVGSIVKIKENGTLRNFIVIAQGYPASGNTLLIRENSPDFKIGDSLDDGDTQWSMDSNGAYSGSKLDSIMTAYLNLLDSSIRNKVPSVTIATMNGNISRKVFALSGEEMGFSVGQYSTPDEGSAIAYFNSNERRVAKRDNFHGGNYYWTRSIYPATTTYANTIEVDGSRKQYKKNSLAYIRPAFMLPGSTAVNQSTNEVIG